ncbi:porin family protein [Novosphingobium profundi]|uniref:porin family protein n=1 Tax=Novosphingobium profundi TaxID=1774954 RepID=UPI001CFD1F3B|nr:porin family protein [Novosphingobium profundi]
MSSRSGSGAHAAASGFPPMAADACTRHARTMLHRIALVSLAAYLVGAPLPALAQGLDEGAVGPAAPTDEFEAEARAASEAEAIPRVEEESAPHEPRRRLFPLGGNAARARGYRIPEPYGLGMLMVWNTTNFNSHDLSAAVAKGAAPEPDANMLPLPSVTTSRLEGDNRMLGFKADLWVFPGVNVFASIGKVRGTNRIDIDIDADAVIPFPFCRPARPCGTVHLPVETKVNNTTVTLGTLLVYGNEHWFALGSIAKTVSISSKERSDVKSTNLGLRAGPRFRLGEDTYFAPYVGGNYFDLDTTVRGVVDSGPVFEDGEALYLRYEVGMKTSHPYALVTGFNFELNRHLSLQAEIQAGATSTRVLATTGVRF